MRMRHPWNSRRFNYDGGTTLRLVAGAFVMISLALGYYLSPYWYLFTAFVGLNLFQSAFTNWCPMMTFLKKMGMKSA